MPIRSAAAFILLAALAGGAVAANGSRHGAPLQKSAAHGMSLEQAVREVQRQTNGRILAADAIPSGRNKLYRIKVLTPDGHVRVMQLHSNAGAPANPPDNNREKH